MEEPGRHHLQPSGKYLHHQRGTNRHPGPADKLWQRHATSLPREKWGLMQQRDRQSELRGILHHRPVLFKKQNTEEFKSKSTKLSMEAHVWNSGTQELRPGGSEGYSQLHNEVEASQAT